MRSSIAAAFALATVSVSAQTTSASLDLSTASPIAGSWTYSAAADGSEAVFSNASAYPQLWVHCTRATRRVSVSRLATAPVPLLTVWTSSLTRSVASKFNPATARVTIELGNYDPLLDALATSRGRIGFGVSNQPVLVVPAWAEAARVIEDCRS